VIAEPPLDAGAVHDTLDVVSPALAATPVGAPGGPTGVTELDAVDAGPTPTLLVAVTVNVYAVPLVSPVTVHDVDAVVQLSPPGEDVTVYPVTDAPPSHVGAVHDTDACAVPAVAVGVPGAAGVIVVAHLRARYSPTWRLSVLANVPVRTMISVIGPYQYSLEAVLLPTAPELLFVSNEPLAVPPVAVPFGQTVTVLPPANSEVCSSVVDAVHVPEVTPGPDELVSARMPEAPVSFCTLRAAPPPPAPQEMTSR
jgi:hypothetical protein